MQERDSINDISEQKPPEKKPSDLSLQIRQTLRALDNISGNLEAAKNGETAAYDLLDESISAVLEMRRRAISNVPHIVWKNEDAGAKVDVPFGQEAERVTPESEQQRGHKYKDADNLIRAKQIAEELGVSIQKFHRIVRSLGLQTTIAGPMHTHHVTTGDYADIREYLRKENNAENIKDFEATQRSEIEVALSSQEFRASLRGDAEYMGAAKRELGMEMVRGKGVLISTEDQEAIRKKIAEIKEKTRKIKRAHDTRVHIEKGEIPEGAKVVWDFCRENNIGGNKFIRIANANGLETFMSGGKTYLGQDSQNRILEILEQEKLTKGIFGDSIRSGDYSLEEHERQSAIARLSSYAREDGQINHINSEAKNKSAESEDYVKPGEVPQVLQITRQRWHQIKKDYSYRSIRIGNGSKQSEYILREDLLRIKEEREGHMNGAAREKSAVRRRSRTRREDVLSEAPEGYISLSQMWEELGITAGNRTRIRTSQSLPFIKVGNKKYFEREKVFALKQIIDVEQTKKPGSRQERRTGAKPAVHPGEGWINAIEAARALSVSQAYFERILHNTRDGLTVNKLGGRNYFREDEIKQLRERRSERVRDMAKPAKDLDVAEPEEKNIWGNEDGESLEIYFGEIRGKRYNPERNKKYGRDILRGQLALSQLAIIQNEGKLSWETEEKIKNLLLDPKVKFLARELENTIRSADFAKRSQNNGAILVLRSAKRHAEWIQRKILKWETEKPGKLEEAVGSRVKVAKKAVDSYENLVGENLRLVAQIAYKNRGRGLPVADLIGAGNIGLMTAAAKYNYKTGYAFSTYAVYWVKQAIGRSIEDSASSIRQPIHIHEKYRKITQVQRELTQLLGREPTVSEIARKAGVPVSDYQTMVNTRSVDSLNRLVGESDDGELEDFVAKVEVDFDGGVYQAELSDVMEKALEHLNQNERRVIGLRFGVGGYEKVDTLDKIGSLMGRTRERVRQLESQSFKKLRRVLQSYYSGQESEVLRLVRPLNEPKSEVREEPPKVFRLTETRQREVTSGFQREKAIKVPERKKADIRLEDYVKPGEVPQVLHITRQGWHQIKKNYSYRSISIGSGSKQAEYILREDLLRIKEEREDHRNRKN